MKLFRRRLSPPVRLVPLAAKRRRKFPRWVRWTLFSILTIIVILLVSAAYYYPKAKRALAAGRQAQAIAKKIPGDISQQNFRQARQSVDALQVQLRATETAVKQMQGLRAWPYVGRQYRAVENLLVVGKDSGAAVHSLVDFAANLFEPFQDRGRISFGSISPEDKGKILAGMTERQEDLQSAREAIHRASQALDQIPTQGLIGPLQRIIAPLKEQFPLVAQGLDQAIPATHVLPAVLGYPNQKSYLFLFENNTELRPGGGFIGTYGVMKVASGEIVSLHTDNSYNLDEAAKNLPTITPPDPIAKYLKVHNWYFRDSNWSPDFPTSAQQALTLYKREGGQRSLDGVMAMTPSAIESLLKLVGPLKVGAIEFTSENFTDKLQQYVDRGYVGDGQTEADRKDILGPLTEQLVDRLLELPLSDWGDLFLVLGQELSQKQILLYMEDSSLQSVLTDLNWSGAMQPAENSDYVMVSDANLASLKTDPVMQRTYTYDVSISDQEAIATLTIHYQNTGKFDWKTTRYNTYTRVYVPSGSTLIESSGAQLREKSNRAGQVETTTELGKTVFGAFKSIEPQTSSDLKLKYRLPDQLAKRLRSSQYQLAWQKPAGMLSPHIIFHVTQPDRTPTTSEGLDNQAKFEKDSVTFEGSLSQDRSISVVYKP